MALRHWYGYCSGIYRLCKKYQNAKFYSAYSLHNDDIVVFYKASLSLLFARSPSNPRGCSGALTRS